MKIKLLGAALGVVFTTAVQAGVYTENDIGDYLKSLQEKHTTAEHQRGLEIYTRQYLIDEGWQDMSVRMEMTLVDATGRSSTREVMKQMFEDGNSPDKTLGIFLQPADIKGVVMLTHEQSYGADTQWLYMPVLRRTKKINAENKSGSFVGTEFSWEDISTTELSKYTYRYLRDEGEQWVVERTPNYDYSGYSKQITWVDKSNYQTVRIDFIDRKGDLLKTLKQSEWKLYLDRYWRASLFEMVNHQNHKKTVLRMSDYAFRQELEPRRFSSLGIARLSAGAAR